MKAPIKIGDLVWTRSDGLRTPMTALRVHSFDASDVTLEWWSQCGSLANPHTNDPGHVCAPRRCTARVERESIIPCPANVEAWPERFGS